MECIYCKGSLVRKQVPYTVVRRGYQLIISDVPAWVCEQCGEPMVIRVGRSGKFLGCSKYPKCKATKPLPAELTGLGNKTR